MIIVSIWQGTLQLFSCNQHAKDYSYLDLSVFVSGAPLPQVVSPTPKEVTMAEQPPPLPVQTFPSCLLKHLASTNTSLTLTCVLFYTFLLSIHQHSSPISNFNFTSIRFPDKLLLFALSIWLYLLSAFPSTNSPQYRISCLLHTLIALTLHFNCPFFSKSFHFVLHSTTHFHFP